MMFLLDIAFGVELLALGLGAAFLIWSLRNQGKGIVAAKCCGIIILFLSIGALICTSFYGTTYWLKGYFKSPSLHKHVVMMRYNKSSTSYKRGQI